MRAAQAAASWTSRRKQFDALAARFKQIAAASLPLSQEIILLDQSSSNYHGVAAIRGSRIEPHSAIHCGARVSGIALAIGVILLLSEIWRRITFRYIPDCGGGGNFFSCAAS